MKKFYSIKILVFIYCLLLTTSGFSQVMDIDLNQEGNEYSQQLDKGAYNLYIYGDFVCDTHTITVAIDKKIDIEDPISVETSEDDTVENKIDKNCKYYKQVILNLEKRATIIVTVTVVDNINNTAKKFTRTLKTIKYKSWITSLGLASSILLQSDTYRTIENTDGTFTIREGGSQNIFRPIPLMQFSYIDLRKDWGFAPSGGIGFDLENISVFGGVSLYFGQSFVVTTGLAFHKQLRLKNDYLPNEIVSSNIAFDDLNTDYYRINPFISLTFRLDKNPFKK